MVNLRDRVSYGKALIDISPDVLVNMLVAT